MDAEKVREFAASLWPFLRLQSTSARHKASGLFARQLREDGFCDVETFAVPADGTTCVGDRLSPFGWEVSQGRLALLNGRLTGDRALADYGEEPFHVICGSVATTVEGEELIVRSESAFLGGEDATDALVLLAPDTKPRAEILSAILDRGGRGLLTDFMPDPFAAPEAVPLVHGCTENGNLSADAETRPFLGFALTPRVGHALRTLAAHGPFRVRVSCDARRTHDDAWRVVSGCIPGRGDGEIWLVVTLDSADAAVSAAAARAAAQRLCGTTPRIGVRLVCAENRLALDAYIARLDPRRRAAVVAAASCEGIAAFPDDRILARCSGTERPSYVNLTLKCAVARRNRLAVHSQIALDETRGAVDDLSLSDPTVGLPTVGPASSARLAFRRQDSQRGPSRTDAAVLADATNLLSDWLAHAANPRPEDVSDFVRLLTADLPTLVSRAPNAASARRRYDFWRTQLADAAVRAGLCAEAVMRPVDNGVRTLLAVARQGPPPPASPWRDYASELVFARKTSGLPQELLRLPRWERPALAAPVPSGPIADVLGTLDGCRSLEEAIERVEALRGQRFDAASIRRAVLLLCRLSEAGYLELVKDRPVTQAQLVAAMRTAGVRSGDLVLVHSSVTAFGHVPGGAATLLAALEEAVGPDGTALLPTFACNLRVLGTVCTLWRFRPYDRHDPNRAAWVGQLPVHFLRTHPDAPESGHFTNGWTGFGSRAAELLSGHPPDDEPFSDRSPLMKAVAANGKLLFLGADVTSCTFLHCLEAQSGVRGIGAAMASVRGADGCPYDVVLRNHAVGHREFYEKGEASRFFVAAQAAGLSIGRASVGLGMVKTIELPPLHRIGTELLKADPSLLGSA